MDVLKVEKIQLCLLDVMKIIGNHLENLTIFGIDLDLIGLLNFMRNRGVSP